jgi:DNA-binding transcriptional MerR regulator
VFDKHIGASYAPRDETARERRAKAEREGCMSTIPYYKNTADTLAEVGISLRQLSYWRKEGLVHLELGDGKRYTEGDIEQLKFLKLLIVDYGFPIEFIRRLQQNEIEDEYARHFQRRPDWPYAFPHFRFLNLKTAQLITPQRLIAAMWSEMASMDPDNDLIERLLLLVHIVLSRYARQFDLHDPRNAGIYAAKRDALMRRIRDVDYVARVRPYSETKEGQAKLRAYNSPTAKPEPWDLDDILLSPEISYGFYPSLPDDPESDREQMMEYVREHARYLRMLEELPEELFPDD